MEKIRGKHLFQVLDDELEKVALEWHTNNIDDNPYSQGVFRVSSIEIVFRKLLEEYLEQELDKAREEGRRETLLEMQREFSEYGVPDDVRYTHSLFYINNIIEEKLSKLRNNK